MNFDDTLKALDSRKEAIDRQIAALKTERVNVVAASSAMAKLVGHETHAGRPKLHAEPRPEESKAEAARRLGVSESTVKRRRREQASTLSTLPICESCGKGYQRAGNRQKRCGRCRKTHALHVKAPPEDDLEPVWNGGEGLTSPLLKSSLGGAVPQ